MEFLQLWDHDEVGEEALAFMESQGIQLPQRMARNYILARDIAANVLQGYQPEVLVRSILPSGIQDTAGGMDVELLPDSDDDDDDTYLPSDDDESGSLLSVDRDASGLNELAAWPDELFNRLFCYLRLHDLEDLVEADQRFYSPVFQLLHKVIIRQGQDPFEYRFCRNIRNLEDVEIYINNEALVVHFELLHFLAQHGSLQRFWVHVTGGGSEWQGQYSCCLFPLRQCFQTLNVLSLTGCSFFDVDSFLALLCPLIRLESLEVKRVLFEELADEFHWTPVRENVLCRFLGNMSNLRELVFGMGMHLSPGSVSGLVNRIGEQLTTLILTAVHHAGSPGGMGLSLSALNAIRGSCINLKALGISSTLMGETCLEPLGTMSKLEYLDIPGHPFNSAQVKRLLDQLCIGRTDQESLRLLRFTSPENSLVAFPRTADAAEGNRWLSDLMHYTRGKVIFLSDVPGYHRHVNYLNFHETLDQETTDNQKSTRAWLGKETDYLYFAPIWGEASGELFMESD